jgi:hypothetical protein
VFVQLAHFATDIPFVAMNHQKALGPVDGLFHRFRFHHRVTADHFLRLGERAVDHADFSVSEPHTHAFRRRPESRGVEHHSSLLYFFQQLAHIAHQLLARLKTTVLVDPDH